MSEASILPRHSTPVEQALEAVLRSGSEVGVLPNLWNPETCPEAFLPWLAWALSVDEWGPEWPVASKRKAIRHAIEVHRRKGTRRAVELALDALGIHADVVEWFESGGAPHTFSLDAYGGDVFAAGYSIGPALAAKLRAVIDPVKPASAHYDLRIGEGFETHVFARAGVRGRAVSRIEHNPDPRTRRGESLTALRAGSRARVLSQVTHDVLRRAA